MLKRKFFILFIPVFFLSFYINSCSYNTYPGPINTNNTGNAAPNIPGNPSPPADTTISGFYHVSFSWQGGDPNAGDTITYDLYLSTSSPATDLLAGNLSITSYDLGVPAPGSYYWRVTAKDQKGLTASSPNWHFIKNN